MRTTRDDHARRSRHDRPLPIIRTAGKARIGCVPIKSEDPDSVAAALRQLLLDPPGPQAVGKRGREAVIEKFHVRGMAEGLLAACSKAAAGR